MSNVLVIGDLHAPATHPGYADFVSDIYDQWSCDRVVFIGDVVDLHSISFHERELDADNVFGEHQAAIEQIASWHDLFPNAQVCIGNHDERVIRKSKSVGIPEVMLKPYSELWETPTWEWDYEFSIDDVRYAHGTGCTGERPAHIQAQKSLVSTVLGHCHTVAGVSWLCGPHHTVFGMSVGCGVDPEHPSMRYGKGWMKRPILGCGVVCDGAPYFEMMDLKNTYNRKHFK